MMAIAFVIGLVGVQPSTDAKSSVSTNIDTTHSTNIDSDNKNINVSKPLTYQYDDVVVQDGYDTINYSYEPSVNARSSSVVAYEYIFGSATDKDMAVDLDEIEIDGLEISYLCRDSRLASGASATGQTTFTTQRISKGGNYKYVYVLVNTSDSNTSTSATITPNWMFGVAETLTVANNINSSVVEYTIVSGQQIDEVTKPTISNANHYFDMWFLDEEYTNPATFPMSMTGQTLYCRFANLSDHYIEWDSDSSSYYVRQLDDVGALDTDGTVETNAIIPTIYDDGTHGVAYVETIGAGFDYFSVAEGGKSSIFDECNTVSLPYTIKAIENSAFAYSSITSINMPKNLEDIRYCAFSECINLKIVDLSKCVKVNLLYEDDPSQFSDCTALESVLLPNTLTGLGYYIFMGCTSLTSIDLPDSLVEINAYAFSGCTSLNNVDLPSNLIVLGGFGGCSSLTDITIPASVRTIHNNTFEGTAISSIEIHNGVSQIGLQAFKDCTKLTQVDLPDTITQIGNYAFKNCSNLTTISIPNGVTIIGSEAFANCSKLTSISIPQSVIKIYSSAFSGSGLTSIDLSECTKLKEINKTMFANCTSLASIEFSSTITYIDDGAFEGCVALNNVTLPNITTLYEGIFTGCTSLSNLILPNSLRTINANVFDGLTSLTSITIPSNVNYIYANAFSGSSLTSITFSDTSTWYKTSSASVLAGG